MIDTINRKAVKTVGADVEAALKAVGEKHGLTFSISGVSFMCAEMDFRINAALSAPAPGVFTRKQDAYRAVRKMHRLPKLNAVIKASSHTLRIVGWNTRARKYPVECTDINTGEYFKLSVDRVRSCTVTNIS